MKLIESLGWKRKTDRIEVTYGDFQALDCSSMTIHDYLKYVKYGFGRATDDACRDVRSDAEWQAPIPDAPGRGRSQD